MDMKSRVKIMRQLVEVEMQFLRLQLPASGSLYYCKDLTGSEYAIPVSDKLQAVDQIVVGPIASTSGGTRSVRHWTLTVVHAPAKREIEFCKQYGKPRLHVERYLREVHEFQQMSPTAHARLLSDYLRLAPYLNVPTTHRFSRPRLRHPDFSPSNVLVSPSDEIVGIIDWQHSIVLPLCLCAGIPKHFQNWGDPLSERLAKLEIKLPDNFQSLDPGEQQAVREMMRKRVVHFYYAAPTMGQMPDHFDALRDENAMLRAKLFDRAGAPWEGDSLSLKYAIIQTQSKWPMPLGDEGSQATDEKSTRASAVCAVKYSENEIQQCVSEYNQEGDKMQELEERTEGLNIDALGWVPNDEQWEESKALAQTIKSGMLEHSSTEIERVAVRDHFPFDE